MLRRLLGLLAALALLIAPARAAAASTSASRGSPELLGIPLEFVLFGATLVGVALSHKHSLQIAVGGLISITALKLFVGFDLVKHLGHEWSILLNLLGLLLGFTLLAKHFEESRLPSKLPDYLPDDWKGGLVLLAGVCVISSFLDNIAAAMIGGAVAKSVFRGKVHIGFIAAIVAASNAGGAGSVVGDTTTTMMWIDRVHPLDVAEAALGAVVALAFFGVFAARQQQRYQPIIKDAPAGLTIDWMRLLIVVMILGGTIATNVIFEFPAAGVWIAILIGALLRPTAWRELPSALKGSAFLLSLVTAASLMPVERLPAASWPTALGLGFLSSVFDNIPLTKLALDQGGYDWGFLAYAVGFGGSMIWFGSSAGVAITIEYPEGRDARAWLRHGWHVAVAYVLGFFAMLLILGWHPDPRSTVERRGLAPSPATSSGAPAREPGPAGSDHAPAQLHP